MEDLVQSSRAALASLEVSGSSMRMEAEIKDSSASTSTSASTTTLAVKGGPGTEGATDAIALRAALADPTAARSFAPGEVAEKYKLLQEMKRKFRRPDFGGPPNRTQRSRSRKRRDRSGSRSRYDSVWIRGAGR